METDEPNSQEPLPATPGMLIAAAGFEGGLALLALAVGWLLGVRPLETAHWSVANVLWGLAAAVPLLAVFVPLLHLPFGPFIEIVGILRQRLLPMFFDASLLDMALVGLLAGIGEEVLFRGLVQGGVAQLLPGTLGTVLAWLLAGALFGALHWLNGWYAALASLIGLYLGGLWLWTGNLLAPIACHAVYDFLVLAYMVRRWRY